jgi:hypothetical protein
MRALPRGLVVLLALAAAPQAGAGTPTEAGWAKAANRACAVSYAKAEALPRAVTSDLLIADLRATLLISKQLTRQLSQIPRPASTRSSVAKLLSLANSGNSLVEEKLLPALATGDRNGAMRFAAQSDQIGARFNSLARTLGARTCAENPTPRG